MQSARPRRPSVVALALLLGPAVAHAHEGHHETLSSAAAVRHLLTQPDHILAFGACIVLAAAGIWRLHATRSARR